MRNQKHRSPGAHRFTKGIALMLGFTMLFSVPSLAGTWAKQNSNEWIYTKEDGTNLADGFSQDGYYIDGTGRWKERSTILGQSLPNRNFFCTSSTIGDFTNFSTHLQGYMTSIEKSYGKVRAFNVGASQISYDELVTTAATTNSGTGSNAKNTTTYTTTESVLYSLTKNAGNDGYMLQLYGRLGRSGIQAYDMEVMRGLFSEFSRTATMLTDAIYSSWEADNAYRIRMGEWTAVGDAYVKYEITNGSGLYYIRPNNDLYYQ